MTFLIQNMLACEFMRKTRHQYIFLITDNGQEEYLCAA